MEHTKRKRLEAKGWKIGDTTDFLGLSDDESQLIEIRRALAARMKQARKSKRVSQEALAKAISSSQSRVAKMEAADRSVSIDLLVRSLVGMGVSREEIGKAIAGK